jgi:hypothetical protein
LWTPSGEHEPDPDDSAAGTSPDVEGRGGTPPEEEAEMARLQAELAATPVADIVANHVVGLWQLAVLHLSLGTEDRSHLPEAQLAIDAVAGVVEGLGSKLGDHEPALRDALAQLRLAFVEVSRADSGTDR